jgi:hypothetical protein
VSYTIIELFVVIAVVTSVRESNVVDTCLVLRVMFSDAGLNATLRLFDAGENVTVVILCVFSYEVTNAVVRVTSGVIVTIPSTNLDTEADAFVNSTSYTYLPWAMACVTDRATVSVTNPVVRSDAKDTAIVVAVLDE